MAVTEIREFMGKKTAPCACGGTIVGYGNIMPPKCSKCLKDEQDERDAQERKREKDNQERRRKKARELFEKSFYTHLHRSGVPFRYLEASLKDFRGQQAGKPPAVIMGSTGCGKTHLAISHLSAHLWERMGGCLFVRMVDFLRELRASYDHQAGGSTEDHILAKYKDVEFLVIDDWGAEKQSEWVAQMLYDLIDYRYSNMKITIITTNLNLQDFALVYGERMISRVQAMGGVANMKGRDRRPEFKDRTLSQEVMDQINSVSRREGGENASEQAIDCWA